MSACQRGTRDGRGVVRLVSPQPPVIEHLAVATRSLQFRLTDRTR